jgi:phosphatidate cytidylyltransferase
LLGQLGDLFASKIKRAQNIKDFGDLFPGHGGLLDRFDSLCMSALFYFVIVSL